MKKTKLIVLLVTVMGMLAACGEFRAIELNASGSGGNSGTNSETNSVVDTNGNVVVPPLVDSETPTSVDQQVLDSYLAEFPGITVDRASTLSNSVQAMQLNMISYMNSSSVNLSVRIQSACDSQQLFSVSGIEISRLQAGETISFSAVNGRSVRMKCTDSDCQEMVVGVIGTVDGQQSFALFPLAATGNVGTSTIYSPRAVEIFNYFFATSTLADYEVLCATQDGELNIVDPTTGTSPTSGSTTGSLVDIFNNVGPF